MLSMSTEDRVEEGRFGLWTVSGMGGRLAGRAMGMQRRDKRQWWWARWSD